VITRKDIEQVLQTKNVDEFKDYWTAEYLSFEEARDFVRKLSWYDWLGNHK